jgi:hypothetical protein
MAFSAGGWRLVATAAENRLSFRHNPHTPFAAASVRQMRALKIPAERHNWRRTSRLENQTTKEEPP